MTLFGPKICPFCGREFTGLGRPHKDGNYCSDCEKKISALIPEDDVGYMSAEEIRQILADDPDNEADMAKKATVPEACPTCGRKMPKFGYMPLRDSSATPALKSSGS